MSCLNPSGTLREPFRNPNLGKTPTPVPVPVPVTHLQRHLHQYRNQHLPSAQRTRGVAEARINLTAVEGRLATEISSQITTTTKEN